MKARVLAVFAAVALLGCSGKPVALGPDPALSWWTDYETADFSDWTSDGRGSTWTIAGGTVDVVSDYARSGQYSMRSAVLSSVPAAPSSGGARRTDGLPAEAYYSAWFYVPTPITSTYYWLFSKFRSRTIATDPSTFVDVWDMDIRVQNGSMHFALYSHDSGKDETPLASPPVPIGRWFQLEAFLIPTPEASGRLSVWIDGTLLYDLVDMPTMPSTYAEWSVGGVAEQIAPVPATLYVDDAAISSRRLGPDFPVFWRAE
jgi:hypothetical protein